MKKLPQTILLSGPAGCGKNAIADAMTREYGYVQIGLADALKRFCKTLCDVPPELMWGESHRRNEKIPPITMKTIFDKHGIRSDDCLFMKPSPGAVRYVNETMLRPDVSDMRAWDRLEGVIRSNEPIDTPRRLLQLVGTEWGRSIDDEIWCRHALRSLNACREGFAYDPFAGIVTTTPTPAYQRPVVITDCRFINETNFFRMCANGLVIWIDDSIRNPGRPKPTHASEPTRESMAGSVHYVFDNNSSLAAMESEIRSPWFQALIHDRMLDGKMIPDENEAPPSWLLCRE